MATNVLKKYGAKLIYKHQLNIFVGFEIHF